MILVLALVTCYPVHSNVAHPDLKTILSTLNSGAKANTIRLPHYLDIPGVDPEAHMTFVSLYLRLSLLFEHNITYLFCQMHSHT